MFTLWLKGLPRPRVMTRRLSELQFKAILIPFPANVFSLVRPLIECLNVVKIISLMKYTTFKHVVGGFKITYTVFF